MNRLAPVLISLVALFPVALFAQACPLLDLLIGNQAGISPQKPIPEESAKSLTENLAKLVLRTLQHLAHPVISKHSATVGEYSTIATS